MQQINKLTGKPYQGTNQEVLQRTAFTSNEWLTFKQAQQLGRRIIKGSKGVRLIKMLEVKDSDDDSHLVPRSFTVFNLEQTTTQEQQKINQISLDKQYA